MLFLLSLEILKNTSVISMYCYTDIPQCLGMSTLVRIYIYIYIYMLIIMFQEGVRFVESLNVPQPNYHRTTAQELYDTLKSQRLKVNNQSFIIAVTRERSLLMHLLIISI